MPPPSILQEHRVLSVSSVEVGECIQVDVDLANENSPNSKLFESKADITVTKSEINGVLALRATMQAFLHHTPPAPARTIIKHDIPSSTTLERKDDDRKLKKRPKKAKDEIDDIFGF
ncbi:hypothetical protein C0993_011535 [Termitomyces sp. T159_Od127]|nr:hypothetical protein C0993_011535 [Termitomyces sp. T159_Od127]